MRHGLLLALLAACGGDDGEPLGGDITFAVGDEVVTPTTGAAIRDGRDRTLQMIILGTRDISCATTLDTPLRKGTYLTLLIDPAQAPGTQDAMVSMVRVISSGSLINGAITSVTVDELDQRLTGSVTFTTDDPDQAITLAASGSFDVVNCVPP